MFYLFIMNLTIDFYKETLIFSLHPLL